MNLYKNQLYIALLPIKCYFSIQRNINQQFLTNPHHHDYEESYELELY